MIRKKILLIMSLKNTQIFKEDGQYIFECPHCEGIIVVSENEVNCKIFRHCVMKSNWQQVNPHASKEECNMLSSMKLVYGCCQPFRLDVLSDGSAYAEKCDWI
jgi:hypothetical protein